MRAVLMDPSKSHDEQFAVWRDAMSPEIDDEEVMALMHKAQQRMTQMAAAKNQKKKVVEGLLPLPKLTNALTANTAKDLERFLGISVVDLAKLSDADLAALIAKKKNPAINPSEKTSAVSNSPNTNAAAPNTLGNTALDKVEHTFAGKDPMSFKSPKGGTPTMIIQTAQGSRYLITSDGMVLRNKSYHANTGGADMGLQAWNDKIEFYNPADYIGGSTFPLTVARAIEKGLNVALSKTKDGKRALVIHDGSQWRIAKISDIYKNVATTDDPIVATFSNTPKLNWDVFDYSLGPNGTLIRVHPGSPVTHGVPLGQQKDVVVK